MGTMHPAKCWMCDGYGKGAVVEDGIELWIEPCPTCGGSGKAAVLTDVTVTTACDQMRYQPPDGFKCWDE